LPFSVSVPSTALQITDGAGDPVIVRESEADAPNATFWVRGKIEIVGV
jgi:hypothetical protein